MARIRTIKPEFWTSPTIARLPQRARLTFIGLWNYVDDTGKGLDDARLIKAAVWPLDDDVSAADVDDDIGAITAARLIERWRDAELDRDLLRVRAFGEHQVINKPSKSKFDRPSPEESNAPTPVQDGSRSAPTPVQDGSLPEGKGKEQGTGSREAAPESDGEPTIDVVAVALSLVNTMHHEVRGVIDALVTEHGHDDVAHALTSLDGCKYQYPSELTKAVRAAFTATTPAPRPPACETCSDTGQVENVDDLDRPHLVLCPELCAAAQSLRDRDVA